MTMRALDSPRAGPRLPHPAADPRSTVSRRRLFSACGLLALAFGCANDLQSAERAPPCSETIAHSTDFGGVIMEREPLRQYQTTWLRPAVRKARGYFYYNTGVRQILEGDFSEGRRDLLIGLRYAAYSYKWTGWWLYSWFNQHGRRK